MQLHQLKRQHPHRRKKIIGRGGKRGTTAGRGTKGQKARAGHRIRPEIREVIKRLPKRRGYRFPSRRAAPQIVSLAALARQFPTGGVISPATLVAKGLIANVRRPVKILGAAPLKNSSRSTPSSLTGFTVENCQLSVAARLALGLA